MPISRLQLQKKEDQRGSSPKRKKRRMAVSAPKINYGRLPNSTLTAIDGDERHAPGTFLGEALPARYKKRPVIEEKQANSRP